MDTKGINALNRKEISTMIKAKLKEADFRSLVLIYFFINGLLRDHKVSGDQ